MSKFKVGDLVQCLSRGVGGRVIEVRTETLYRLEGDGIAPQMLWSERVLQVPPEPEITDAERVAAACHKKFCGLDELGCGWHFVESSQGRQNSGKFRTQLEALDAWVRHLRSIGWKYQEGK